MICCEGKIIAIFEPMHAITEIWGAVAKGNIIFGANIIQETENDARVYTILIAQVFCLLTLLRL